MLFLLIGCLSAVLMQRSYSMYKARGTMNACIEDAYGAQDFFMYDIKTAPVDVRAWHHKEPTIIEWKLHNGPSIRWQIEKGALTRTHIHEGKSQKSIAARGLLDGTFAVQTEGQRIHTVSLTMRVRTLKGVTDLETIHGYYGISYHD